ncbi:MAG: ferritin-like domain-containing protein [Clostridia bacterium]|jgi:rubrerythrin|nr:ferritin-like domain-containing protein [Clostridia bacterium]
MPYSDAHDRYPATDILRCDPRMARLLFRAYYDELSTISTYIYNSIQLTEECPQTATLFESLAMTEMRHFRLLGKAIRRLGGNPVIRTDLRITSFEICPDAPRPRIDQTVKSVIRIAIAAEQTAAWEYRALADKTCDGALKQLLCRLAADEEEHARMLQNLSDC